MQGSLAKLADLFQVTCFCFDYHFVNVLYLLKLGKKFLNVWLSKIKIK